MTSAYILPYDHESTGSIVGVNPSELWALTPSGPKVPAVGTFRTFYQVPDTMATSITSLGTAFSDKSTEARREVLRRAIGSSVKDLQTYAGISQLSVDASLDPHAAAVAAYLAMYKFTLKTDPPSPFNPNLTTPIPAPIKLAPIVASPEWTRGQLYAEAQNLSRTLCELPANMMTPTKFCERTIKEFAGIPNVEITVRDAAWAKQQKMNVLLSVAQGSDEPMKFLEIHYKGGKAAAKPLAFVGKGITFDSGGISIKPAENMKAMRGDMGGAAAIVAATLAIAKMKLPINVITVAPLTENMPGPSATKPGDIFYAMNGKSVEVDNTDAEGRLILSDAMWYTSDHYKPHTLIDVATLTGAMVTAVGHSFSGVFCTSDDLWDQLKAAGDLEHDRFWRMPLDTEYMNQINSSNADLMNIGGRAAGAATAALFLKPFVKGLATTDEGQDTIDWAHIDIAGSSDTAFAGPYQERGMTGRPTRGLIEYARALAAASKRR